MENIENTENIEDNKIYQRLFNDAKDFISKYNALKEVFYNAFGEENVDFANNDNLINTDLKVAKSRAKYNYSHNIIHYTHNLRRCVFNYTDEDREYFFYILIRFPEVKITNEYNKSIIIKDLFARLTIDESLKLVGQIQLNRSTYTYKQFSHNYMHSHMHFIPNDDYTAFNAPCFGSGPIVETMVTLNTVYDLDIYELLCYELAKYVTVESISGGPWHSLSSIDSNALVETNDYKVNNEELIDPSDLPYFNDFIHKALKNKAFNYNYNEGSYNIAMPYTDFVVALSNMYIEFLMTIKDSNILSSLTFYMGYYVVNLNGIYSTNEISEETKKEYRDNNKGKLVCYFKGKAYCIKFEEDKYNNDKPLHLLNPKICNFIYTRINQIINFYYGRKENYKPGSHIQFAL